MKISRIVTDANVHSSDSRMGSIHFADEWKQILEGEHQNENHNYYSDHLCDIGGYHMDQQR